MLEKNQSNASQRKMQIVDFLDIDTNKITFQKPKSNKYNGSQIGILYNGETMYVKYEGVTPFGLKENFDNDGNYQNTSMQINCKDKYLEKAKELDKFFINTFYENKWGLNRNIPLQYIEGYDEHGQGGLWKRICKDSYKVDKETKEREYLDYPSKMEFTLFYKGDSLQTTFFTWEGIKLDYVPDKGYPVNYELGPHSRVKFIAAWFSLTRGTFGLTLKPKLMQMKYKKESNQFETCILDSDSESVVALNPEEDEEFALKENLDPEWYKSK